MDQGGMPKLTVPDFLIMILIIKYIKTKNQKQK